MTFELVLALPYPIAFAPLGNTALLVAGQANRRLLLSLEGNHLHYRPELARLNQPARPFTHLSVGGVWPDNAWLALSSASDAGPSSADVYRWRGTQWVKQHEHDRGVIDLALWRGNLVMQGSLLAVPAWVPQRLDALSSAGLAGLNATFCSSSGDLLLAPIHVQDDALNAFGYECGPNGLPPETGVSVVVETWSAAGVRSTRRMPLPSAWPLPERLFVDPQGLLALFAPNAQQPRQVARFTNDGWRTVLQLPADFLPLSAPGTLELWGVAGQQLRAWQGRGASTLALGYQPMRYPKGRAGNRCGDVVPAMCG